MPDQPLPSDLQTVLLEALRAYELARATRLRAEGDARAARRAREEALQAEEAHARQALEAERRAEESVLRAEQERLGRLQAAADPVESAARALLEKAGLAYIAGAPATPTGQPSAPRRADADAAQAFAEAQTAYADLRVALVTLAQAHLEAGRWEEARRVLQPLLEDTRAPLYAEARDLLAESHYRPALAALEAGQWAAARKGFAEVLKVNPAYRDAAALEREAHLRSARAALEEGRYDEARPPLEAWLKAHKDDAEARDLLAESYYRPALAALEAEQWETARKGFAEVLKINSAYRDAAALEKETYYVRPVRAALDAGRYTEARERLEAWLETHNSDDTARELLAEAHYRLALTAMETGQWGAARRSLAKVLEIYPAHRDAVKIERLIRCILPTRISLEASRYAEARDRLETWVAEHQDDVEARELLAESYYHLALSAIQTKDWRQAGRFLRMLRQINPQYRDTAEWIQRYPLLGWLSGAIRIIAIPNEFSGSKSIAFSPDSRLMVSVRFDDVKIWEVASTMLLHILKGHKDDVNSVAFSPDGYCLASGSDDETIKIWDVAAGQLLYSIDVGSRVLSVAFSVNGTLALGTGDGQIKIWLLDKKSWFLGKKSCKNQDFLSLLDEKSSYLLNTISGHKGVVHSVAFSPDGKLLASGSVDRTVKIWEVYSFSKNPLHLIDELKDSVYSVVFSPDGRLLASGTSNAVNIWEVDSARLLHTLIGHESTVMSVAFSPDGHLLASGSTDGMLKIWEVSSGQILHTLSMDECESASEQLLDTLLYGYKRKRIEVVYSLTFSPDGRLLASGSSNAVCICSVEAGVLTGGASND